MLRAPTLSVLLLLLAIVTVVGLRDRVRGVDEPASGGGKTAVQRHGAAPPAAQRRAADPQRPSMVLPADVARDPFGVQDWGAGVVATTPGSSEPPVDDGNAATAARVRPAAPQVQQPSVTRTPSPADRAPRHGSDWRSPPPSD